MKRIETGNWNAEEKRLMEMAVLYTLEEIKESTRLAMVNDEEID
jgi:hypothetical protein